MIGSAELSNVLKALDYDLYTGVPCSFFKTMIDTAILDEDVAYIAAANEGAAVALAAGAEAGGRKPVVMVQNSGLGNMINPLTSLASIYRQPMLLLVSGRAYKVNDEPQHIIMGRQMHAMLDACEIPHRDLPEEPAEIATMLRELTDISREQNTPVAVVVPKGTVGKGLSAEIPELPHPMSRRDAITAIIDSIPDGTPVVATTGMTARELFEVDDQPAHFYMMGSMGHAAAFGFGVAIAAADKKVVVLDGDGSALMHLGTFSTVGHYAPANLVHVVIDNEAYESTGNQDTTSSTTDLSEVARACGYKVTRRFDDETTLRTEVAAALASNGPTLLHVKVHRHVANKPVRITSRWTAADIGRRFRDACTSTNDSEAS